MSHSRNHILARRCVEQGHLSIASCLLSRIGRKPTFVLCTLSEVVIFNIVPLATNFYLFVILQFVGAMAQYGTYLTSFIIGTLPSPENQRLATIFRFSYGSHRRVSSDDRWCWYTSVFHHRLLIRWIGGVSDQKLAVVTVFGIDIDSIVSTVLLVRVPLYPNFRVVSQNGSLSFSGYYPNLSGGFW